MGTSAVYNYNNERHILVFKHSILPPPTRKKHFQHIAQLAESSTEYWIACGIHRAAAVILKQKKKKEIQKNHLA